MAHTRREFLKTAAAGAAATGTLGFPMVSRAQQKKLTVWWNRGYYKEEDEAMLKIAEDFRKAKNVDLDISFTIQEDLLKKIISAMTARRCPDVAFCFYNDSEVIHRRSTAGKGRLVEEPPTSSTSCKAALHREVPAGGPRAAGRRRQEDARTTASPSSARPCTSTCCRGTC